MLQLQPHQTHHLIVLVGTNPLPNYVAARLLLNASNPQHKVWLVHSANTSEIAKQLSTRLAKDSIVSELYKVDESSPIDIRRAILHIAKLAKGRLGLHYTGGTKAMSVHAYLALKEWADEVRAPRPVYSYLDARRMQMVIDAGNPDGTDAHVPVDLALPMTVTEIAALHGREFQSLPHDSPILPEQALALMENFLKSQGWSEWTRQTLRTLDATSGKRNLKKPAELKDIEMPVNDFAGVRDAFHRLAPPVADTLSEWARISSFPLSTKGIEAFAKWLDGGWLEDVVLQMLNGLQVECRLTTPGIGYNVKSLSNPGKTMFEFDVAATRGHQLFAISCTTSADKDLCKSKLFEVYRRAKQLGGDAARIALVSFHSDAPALVKAFADEWEPDKSVLVLGAKEFPDLQSYLRTWINTARD